jgi:hypothetical protein
VVRFIGTSKNSGCCFGIQGLSPYFMTWLVPHQIKLTSGRHSKQLHQYPAFGGWAQEVETILSLGCLSQSTARFRSPGSVRTD